MLFTGHLGVYVPRTDGFLCTRHIYFQTLLIGHTKYSHCLLRHPLFLGRYRVTPSLYRRGPRGMLLPRKIINIVASFLSLFEVMPTCVCLIGFGDKLVDCFTTCLPGLKSPSAISSFGPNEFERTLAGPTTQITERHDYRSILDYLLMKLRTALDKDWLHKLPLLHKVIIYLLFSKQQLTLAWYFIPLVLF